LSSNTRRTCLAALGTLVGLRFLFAATLPIVGDEAYYAHWARALDRGYFDHPPGVAWVGSSALLAPGSAFAARLGTLLVSTLGLAFFVSLLRRSGLSRGPAFTAGLLLFCCNVAGIVSGFLLTPDAALFTAWTAALAEAARALSGERRRWILVGLACGLGLLAKYMMVLLAPALLWGAWRGDPRSLRGPWPWAGLAVALAVFAPHVLWNAENDWVPMRFQLGHGFGGEQELALATDLPRAELRVAGGPEEEFGRSFGVELDTSAPSGSRSKDERSLLVRTSAYLGALLALWGVQLVPLAGILSSRRRPPTPQGSSPAPTIRREVRPLLVASALVPVVFFGLTSLRSHVEANWASTYMVSASVLCAPLVATRLRSLALASAGNALLLALLAVHAHFPLTGSRQDRIHDEMSGWPQLAERIAEIEGPVYFGRHVTGSMLFFHDPDGDYGQWPGITRPSEFLRRASWVPHTRAELEALGSFWLVSGKTVPPRLAGFRPVEAIELVHCSDGGWFETRAVPGETRVPPCPDGRVHDWYLVHYVTETTAPTSGTQETTPRGGS